MKNLLLICLLIGFVSCQKKDDVMNPTEVNQSWWVGEYDANYIGDTSVPTIKLICNYNTISVEDYNGMVYVSNAPITETNDSTIKANYTNINGYYLFEIAISKMTIEDTTNLSFEEYQLTKIN